jgi:nucleoside-specific outer membrane channel protein Tsx
MKKLLLVVSALAALMISVPVAMARDANRDAMRQPWRDQVNLEKQQARIEGLKPDTVITIAPGATKPGTTPRLRAKNCSCEACKI